MKIKALLKAFQFMLVPTLTAFLFLVCAFWSFSKALAFISSDSGWAILIRITLLLAEVVLVAYLYLRNLREMILEEGDANIGKGREIDSYNQASQLLGGGHGDSYRAYKTSLPTMLIIERIPKVNI